MDTALALASGLYDTQPGLKGEELPETVVYVAELRVFFEALGENILKLPDYQRPYVWGTDKIDILLDDLLEFIQDKNAPDYYYIGTLLFHQLGSDHNIVDGQQRLTTLLILDFELNGSHGLMQQFCSKLQMSYSSPVSVENIGRNRDHIRKKLIVEGMAGKLKDVMQKIIFTAIITPSADDAFVYFDSQNNRGISLGSVDFLKAYHLRAVKGDTDQDSKQSLIAKQWDRHNRGQFLEALFSNYLWRVRKWKGKEISFEDNDKILKEFQKHSRPKTTDITVYSGPNNKSADSLAYSGDGKVTINTKDQQSIQSPTDYPFSLRQPIQKGTGFFLYTDKYTSLYKLLFPKKENEKEDVGEKPLWEMRQFYNQVYVSSGLSAYLKEFFILCVLHYYDRFGEKDLLPFCLWLDYLLGSYRIKQDSIVAQTPIKIVRDKPRNLLDVIQGAYEPEEVITFMRSITVEADYEAQIKDSGVKADYVRAVQKYYKKSTSLTDKKKWIYEHCATN